MIHARFEEAYYQQVSFSARMIEQLVLECPRYSESLKKSEKKDYKYTILLSYFS
jgi:hypothetical protein